MIRIRHFVPAQETPWWILLEQAPVLGVLIVIALVSICVIQHPSSLQGYGNHLLWIDVSMLVAYGIAASWLRYHAEARTRTTIRMGTLAGLLLGAILVGNHLIEVFTASRGFATVIAPVFLSIALLAITGSMTNERTGSTLHCVTAGLWCAMVGNVVLLGSGLLLDLVDGKRIEQWLKYAFLASGMSDPLAFVVKNTLEAASEALIRMPLMALLVSLLGASAHAFLTRRSRGARNIVVFGAPVIFLAGAAALWYANSIARAARPPFVLAGLLLASLSLSAAHPIWSVLRHGFSQQ